MAIAQAEHPGLPRPVTAKARGVQIQCPKEEEGYQQLPGDAPVVRVQPMLREAVLKTYPNKPEAGLTLVREAFPPFLVAGLGMVAAGLLLGRVRQWGVFVEVDEMLILVPALLGLKGNLEMTLASRLSTHANLGHLDEGKHFSRIVLGNLAVVQCQAIVVGFLASLVATMLDLLTAGSWNPEHMLLMASSAVAAASIASFVLSAAMIGVVLCSRRHGINPDNVSSPIAGMLGDFCTLGLLAAIADVLWGTTKRECWWAQWAVVLIYSLLAPKCAMVAYRNPFTTEVLREGWKPVIIAMLVSSGGGLILKHAAQRFSLLAPFAPVMNGAGGNLAAVQASRLSTDLHSNGRPGIMPSRRASWGRSFGGAEEAPSPDGGALLEVEDALEEPLTPNGTFSALLSKNSHACSARVLITLAVPGALCFVSLIVKVRSGGQAMPEPLFVLVYVAATLIQVCVLFVCAHGIINALWRDGTDPDNAAIPYVTSLGDLVGTTCLTGAFFALYSLGGTPWTGADLLQMVTEA